MFADALIPIGNCCVMCAGKCCALGGLLDWVCLEILEDGEKLTIRLLRGVPVGHVPRLNRNRTSAEVCEPPLLLRIRPVRINLVKP